MSADTPGHVSRKRFLEAAEDFSRGRFLEAAAVLAAEAETGDAESQNLLGVMHLNGMGIDQDTRRASQLFAAAAGSGLKEGHYNLSNLLYNGFGVSRDTNRGQEHLLAAARLGHRPALRSLGYLYHLAGPEERWQRLSTLSFRLAAEAGDPLGQYTLGLRLARGQGCERDLAGALRWLESAAQARVYLAGAHLMELRSRRVAGGAASPPSGSIEDLVPFALAPVPSPPASRSVSFLSEHPDALDGYLCDHLINAAAHYVAPSWVVDPGTGKNVQSEVRTSYSMYFHTNMYDAVLAESVRRLAGIAGLPVENAEPLGVLRYGVGQEYRPHYDFYDDPQHEAQRLTTVFVYLNDVAEGGGTEFPRLGVKVEPARSKAVKFLNCDAAGKPNPETLHAGLPVIRGEKWLATLWFWDRPFLWFAHAA